MKEEQVTVRNYPGIHLHPANLLVRKAGQYQSEIWVTKGEVRVNGKSIMGIMMLAAETGSVLSISAEGPDEDAAVTGLVALIDSKFGEEAK